MKGLDNTQQDLVQSKIFSEIQNENHINDHINNGNGSHKDHITIYAILMAIGIISSRVLGLVRDQVFAALFPTTVRDAWTAAFRLPNMFRRLLGEGSLSVSFIPVFIQARAQDPTGVTAHNLANSFYTFMLIALATLTCVGILWPEAFLNLMLDPSYSDIPGKFELTVRMTRIMFGFIFFMSTYAYFMGILNAIGRFGIPAMAPTFFNIVMIISNFFPQKWLNSPGDAIAWGVVIGGALQAGILLFLLQKLGYFPKFRWEPANNDVLKILRNIVPGMLGLGLLQITAIVNLRFASSLGEGPITYIYLADRLLELPLSLVSVSLATALLPTLSILWAKDEKNHMVEMTNYYLRLNLFFIIPAAIGLFVLASPIVEILFQRGQFSLHDATRTVGVVKIYSLVLVSASCVRVFVPSFFAIKNTWLPALVSIVSLTGHILLAPVLMRHWGLEGLVSSSFFSGTLNFILLMIFYKLMIGPLHFHKIMRSILQFLTAGVGLWVALQFYPKLLEEFGGSGVIAKVLAIFLIIAFGAIVYFGLSYLLKIEEFKVTLGVLIRKIHTRLKL